VPPANEPISSHARRLSRSVAERLPAGARDRLRPIARRLGLAAVPGRWSTTGAAPWDPRRLGTATDGALCNICRWRGPAFEGIAHVEAADCPQCRSIARDRYLHWCFTSRTSREHGNRPGARLLETSPRLGTEYRDWMRRWYSYRASDFDLSAHRADLQLDLQQIDLPDASVDVVLTAHVLEHVPDTARALAELFRVIAPGGRMYLQIPLVYGQTSVPSTPEFHADNTPVFFNFGWDLTDQIRAAGFTTTVLVAQGYLDVLRSGGTDHDPASDGFHLSTLIEHVRLDDLDVVATAQQQQLMGFDPPWQHATWECLRP